MKQNPLNSNKCMHCGKQSQARNTIFCSEVCKESYQVKKWGGSYLKKGTTNLPPK